MKNKMIRIGLQKIPFRIFETNEDIQKWVVPRYAAWHKSEQHAACYHSEKTQAIKQYCGNANQYINKALRDCKETPLSDMCTYDYIPNLVRDLNTLLGEVPLDDNIVVYRSVSPESFQYMQDYAIEAGCHNTKHSLNYLLDYGFMSTSLLSDVFSNHSAKNYKMQILIPKGAIGAYVELVSRRPSEQEFLLANHCLLRVLSFQETDRMIVCVLVKQKNKRLLCRHFLHL